MKATTATTRKTLAPTGPRELSRIDGIGSGSPPPTISWRFGAASSDEKEALGPARSKGLLEDRGDRVGAAAADDLLEVRGGQHVAAVRHQARAPSEEDGQDHRPRDASGRVGDLLGDVAARL